MQFYFAEADQQKGPVEAGQLRSAGVRPETLVWREGMAEWLEASRVPELAGLFDDAGGPSAAPPAPQPYTPQPYAQQPYGPTGADGGPPAYDAPPGQPAGVAPQLAYGGYANPYQPPPQQGMSVASMVLGIIAIPATFCYGTGIVLAILAVVFGHLGQAQHRRATGQSNGMATAGLICGYLSLAIVVALFVVVFIVIGAASMSGN